MSRPVLRSGSIGVEVMELQEQLKALGYTKNIISNGVVIDSIFGTGTERAVRAVQARGGLAPDGVVGPDTYRLLDAQQEEGAAPLPVPRFAFMTPENYPVTSPQGWRQLGGVDQYHGGVDFGMPQGTPLYSPFNGQVVALDHNHAIAGGIVVVRDYDSQWGYTYCHLSDIGVSLGDRISARQYIGKSGGTPGTHGAGYSTGAHLHVSIQSRGISIDPSRIMRLPLGAQGVAPPDRLT
jgi:murein DD-endopeptidase MepM/ murein hydrolase activator NlpD